MVYQEEDLGHIEVVHHVNASFYEFSKKNFYVWKYPLLKNYSFLKSPFETPFILVIENQSTIARLTPNQRQALAHSWKILKLQLPSLTRRIFTELEIICPKVKDVSFNFLKINYMLKFLWKLKF